ncbi:Leucyl-tRNA synthetase [hydrothermal vent metagenome]|uniref:leucine--tRNA ligase n=1 Tax=hydrothermal vent metagenome TaxID=652676 RepID=A0A3B0VFY4_9ZZZZ
MDTTEKYNAELIEKKWQKSWEDAGAFKYSGGAAASEGVSASKGVSVAEGATLSAGTSGREKYYVLEMFPYPSGKIHMGHVRNYSIGDVIARFMRMRGFDVLHPMGWDSFGLPAENAAIEHKIPPALWTHQNIASMRDQLKRLGLGYDWSREIATCTPEYYRWNQWIFLRLLEKGLAYKKRSAVNWCPDCATVLANEQVEEGLCWRCEARVEQKSLEQWFFKITEYAEELLAGTDNLPGWPERVLVMQRNWIGKSTGAELGFKVKGREERIDIFTTRPDTLYGTTFMSLAVEHPFVEKITTPDKMAEVKAFIEKTKAEAEAINDRGAEPPKEGCFTGAYCINPLTGKEIPVFIANFVLMGYGTGAVMAVPAHDQRDFEFAKKYDLPVKVVIMPKASVAESSDIIDDSDGLTEAYTEPGVIVNSGEFSGLQSEIAKLKIVEKLEAEGLGRKSTTYRLRDWGISRQRYWGCPIPVIYCDDCGAVPVPDEQLPVLLPEDISLDGKGGSPLEAASFTKVDCPGCGKDARRETDTMDTFVDSSWYFLRYASPDLDTAPFDKVEASRAVPVDRYIGGIEHAVMHLLYARFFTKALRDLGLVDCDEPFENLLTQGMVCKEITRCPEHGYLAPQENDNGLCTRCGKAVEIGAVEKMSKSKKNTVDPHRIIERYGADTTRLFTLFAAPPERDLDWSEDGVEGAYRFIGRVWRLITGKAPLVKEVRAYDGAEPLDGALKAAHRLTHVTIKKVTGDIEKRFHFNTAISAVMELVNSLYLWKGAGDKAGKLELSVLRESLDAVVLLVSPFAPHLAEELWQRLGRSRPLYATPWPGYSEDALTTNDMTVIVQVNGKMRAKMTLPAGSGKDLVEDMAKNEPRVVPWLEGKVIRKMIYVPGKIFNIVVG